MTFITGLSKSHTDVIQFDLDFVL